MANSFSIRQPLDRHGQLIMPGVYDVLSAKIAARAGFEAVFITGYSLSATLAGNPILASYPDGSRWLPRSASVPAIDTPVIVDADTGYGNAINVIRTVQDLIRCWGRRHVS